MRVLPLLISLLLSSPYAQAGPYITIKSKAKGVDRNFDSLNNAARIGIEWEINNFTPYIEVGVGVTITLTNKTMNTSLLKEEPNWSLQKT